MRRWAVLSAQEILEAREALTLELLDEACSFGLTKNEDYDSDGWAWLFLSLREKYRQDYEKHEKRERKLCAAEDHLKASLDTDMLPKWVLPDCDGECLRRFSLVAWFDPKLPTLPYSSNKAGWFDLPPTITQTDPEVDRWLTLREDDEYRAAYAEQNLQMAARNHANSEIEHFVAAKNRRDVFPDYDGSCRRVYGLAAWLSPSSIKLPLLRNKGSWFFPLKALVLENYNRKNVVEPLNLDPAFPQFPTRDRNKASYIFLGTQETPFGYRRAIAPLMAKKNGDSLRILWAALDCSIPIEAQLSVFRDLAKNNRAFLRDFDLKTRKKSDLPRLDQADSSEVFEHVVLKTSGGCRSGGYDRLAWFAFSVDVLGPIESQCVEVGNLLKQRHKELCKKIAEPSPVEWIQAPLPYVDNGHGGCRLKALHMLAELATLETPPRKIAAILGVTPKATTGYTYPWHRQFDENIDDYIEKGLQLVNGDYKYLVHCQVKPTDSSNSD